MDRRTQKGTAARTRVRIKRRPKSSGHVFQFLLIVSAGILLLGSLVAWKIYANNGSWRDWSMSMRSGLLGMNGARGGGSGNDEGDDSAGKAMRYLGAGYADMGQFSVGRYDAITNRTLTVNFQLKGMTPCDSDASFHTFMDENGRAFRDRVTEAVRDCTERDYGDAKSVCKKVITRVNRAFNGRFLESAELVDFEVLESIGSYGAEAWETAEQEAENRQNDS